MIELIRQLCRKAGCQPKDLVVEWTPGGGSRVVATNSQGVRSYLHVLARLDHIAQAVWLCANGQEHLYSEVRQKQAAIDAKVKEWLAANVCHLQQGVEDQPQGHPAQDTRGGIRKDWRQLDSVPEIMRAFPMRPSSDDIIDLYQRNKHLKSSVLKALLERHSR